jgi:hypothetical protein
MIAIKASQIYLKKDDTDSTMHFRYRAMSDDTAMESSVEVQNEAVQVNFRRDPCLSLEYRNF